MPSTILTFAEFWVKLRDAMLDVDALAKTDPDPMIGSIQRQLQYVAKWTNGGKRPAQADLDKLTFGLMASRAVDDVDRRLAQELYDLASYLQYWKKGPNDP